MLVIVEVFITVLVTACLTWWIYSKNKNKDFFKNIPGPRPIPFLGNVLDFKSTTEILDVFMKYTRDYGSLVKVHLGPIDKGVLASDYKFLECVLSSTRILNKSDQYHSLRPWLGTGLLTSDEQFIDIFESGGNKLVQKLEKTVDQKSVDVYPYVTLCTLDIICETAMGTKINAQDNVNSVYVRSVKEMCKIIIERAFYPLQLFDVTYPLTKNYYIQKNALNILHKHTNNVITQRRKVLENKTEEVDDHSSFGTKKKKVFLDLLLEATVDGRPLTQEEIREEVDTFMFEGHDTTASAISFALFCLANHPEVQEKTFEEQEMLFGDNKNPTPTYADLQSMKYLEQVIKETLRLYPSVPFYSRKTNQPVEYNGTIIPEGVSINIFAYGIHRNPEYFEEPDRFNPSRFENVDGKLPYAFIPFSAGPRNCIGQKFAMLEMKSTISKIIRKFELRPASPQHKIILASEAVLKSANGIKISLSLRK
ncbi:cytochrome P450 4c3-like [Asbolus verrucosus]|uniref:Cytochrome P450 4c3-like n=1 Tax=Asbolus verrucosus TaxID=1661398 RepID=A0A482VCP7_ASBVE|nr:cytochrome P450 4c3-like [Asbolus verrucosus]